MYIASSSNPCAHWLDAAASGLRRKWPFQSSQPARRPSLAGQTDAVRGGRQSASGEAGAVAAPQAGAKPLGLANDRPSLKAMVVDVVLVLAWGAMIPGLMWLGHAGGF